MNKDLYIELLEKKVSDLETELVTFSDKLIEADELTQIIIDMIDSEESERLEELRNYEKMDSKTEKGLLLYRSKWSSVSELREKVKSYYESRVGLNPASIYRKDRKLK